MYEYNLDSLKKCKKQNQYIDVIFNPCDTIKNVNLNLKMKPKEKNNYYCHHHYHEFSMTNNILILLLLFVLCMQNSY